MGGMKEQRWEKKGRRRKGKKSHRQVPAGLFGEKDSDPLGYARETENQTNGERSF